MSDAAQATVLVVDDNAANRALAESTLTDEGYRVLLAADGAAGLALFRQERPDCVLLDVRMPGMDGFAVCKEMRAAPFGPETPILFLTAQRDIDTFDRALHAGGDDFLTKPVRPTELLVRVQSALKLRRVSAELREHYELLKGQRDDLLRLQLQKERLMAFVVHDLKNPVNSLDLHAQLLLRDKALSESSRESAAQIRTEARQLTRMILNLLDLSKADEGRLAPKRAELALRDLVEEVLGELAASAQSRKITLESSVGDLRASLDRDLVRRMLINLVENAIRYAPADSTVRVSCDAVATGLELRVVDAGLGIPVDMRQKVFDAFVQVEAGERAVSRGGRGLGLAFCKLVAEAHGGSIRVEDATPGAAFCVTLPQAV